MMVSGAVSCTSSAGGQSVLPTEPAAKEGENIIPTEADIMNEEPTPNGQEIGDAQKDQKEDMQPEKKYETEYLRYTEPDGVRAIAKNMDKLETEFAAYYFEPDIEIGAREECMEATEKLFRYLDDPASLRMEIVVYNPNTYHDTYIAENRLYLPLQQWTNADYITMLLLLKYGEWSNYGMAYGYANYLCGKLGWECLHADSFMPLSKDDLYDMNLLCFDEAFADSEDVEAGKSFVGYLVEQYGEENAIRYICADGKDYLELGKTYAELVSDRNGYIVKNYSQYSVKNE